MFQCSCTELLTLMVRVDVQMIQEVVVRLFSEDENANPSTVRDEVPSARRVERLKEPRTSALRAEASNRFQAWPHCQDSQVGQFSRLGRGCSLQNEGGH
jgi:hypothetical protein